MSSNIVPVLISREVLAVDNIAVCAALQMLTKLYSEEWLFDSDKINDLYFILKNLLKRKCVAKEFICTVWNMQVAREEVQSLVLVAKRLCSKFEDMAEILSLNEMVDDIIQSSN